MASIPFLVIPAAGKGTRMKLVDPGLPKELLPIGGKPAIQYAIEEGMDAGIERIVVIISKEKECIRDRLAPLPYPLTYLYQQEPKGEADAIALAEPIVGNRPLAIMYPDNLYLPAPGVLRTLTAVFHRHDLDVLALSAVTAEHAAVTGNAGRVDLEREGWDLYRIRRFHPKAPGYFQTRFKGELRACGIMVTGAHIFAAIARARAMVNHGELTDKPVLEVLLRVRGLLGYRLPGTVYDVGNPAGYWQCMRQYY